VGWITRVMAMCLLGTGLTGCHSFFPPVGTLKFDSAVRGPVVVNADKQEAFLSEGSLRLVRTDSQFVLGGGTTPFYYEFEFRVINEGTQTVIFQPESFLALAAPFVHQPFPATLPDEPEPLIAEYRASHNQLMADQLRLAPGQRQTLWLNSNAGFSYLLVRYEVADRPTWALIKLTGDRSGVGWIGTWHAVDAKWDRYQLNGTRTTRPVRR
jgi:hypothetical protein